MLAKAVSCAVVGLEGAIVEVEVDISPGLPAFNIVGLPDAAVQEARERVRAAIRNSGCDFPMRRITVKLAPADLEKEGPLLPTGHPASTCACAYGQNVARCQRRTPAASRVERWNLKEKSILDPHHQSRSGEPTLLRRR